MPRYLVHFLLIPLLLSTLSVAADTININYKAFWTQKLPTDAGTIQFSTELNQNDYLDIIFTSGKKIEGTHQLLKIRVSDTNCVGEHETWIRYMSRKDLFNMHYFDKKIPWKMTHTLSISWTPEKELIISSNGESTSLKTYRQPGYIHIISNTDYTTLNNLIIK